MKVTIIINTLLPMLGLIQCMRAISASSILYEKVKANKIKLQEQGLIFLLSEDKQFLMWVAKCVITLIAVANGLLFTWSVSRISDNFAPYATGFIKYTAIIFHLTMFLISHFVYLIYSRSDFKIIKWVKNKF